MWIKLWSNLGGEKMMDIFLLMQGSSATEAEVPKQEGPVEATKRMRYVRVRVFDWEQGCN